MRLSYLVYFHRAIYFMAILGAVFFGMLLKYNTKQQIDRAIVQTEQRILIDVYLGTSIKGLSEVRI